MKFKGEFLNPDQTRNLEYEISHPKKSEIAPYECHVRLSVKESGDVLVSSPVYGEDSFQALHSATMLIHTLSGWKAVLDEAIISDPTS